MGVESQTDVYATDVANLSDDLRRTVTDYGTRYPIVVKDVGSETTHVLRDGHIIIVAD